MAAVYTRVIEVENTIVNLDYIIFFVMSGYAVLFFAMLIYHIGNGW
jgi:hypothetical protein